MSIILNPCHKGFVVNGYNYSKPLVNAYYHKIPSNWYYISSQINNSFVGQNSPHKILLRESEETIPSNLGLQSVCKHRGSHTGVLITCII